VKIITNDKFDISVVPTVMKYDPTSTANALAVTSAILYVFCRTAVSLFPNLSISIAQSWFHGLEISQVSGWSLSLNSFIMGLITITGAAWLTGYIFAKVYNYFAKR